MVNSPLPGSLTRHRAGPRFLGGHPFDSPRTRLDPTMLPTPLAERLTLDIGRVFQRCDVARLQAVVAPLKDAILVLTDHRGHIAWASAPGSIALLGCGPDRLVGTAAVARLPPRQRSTVKGRVSLPTGRGHSAVVDHRIRHADGSWQDVRTISWPLPDGTDTICLVHIVLGIEPSSQTTGPT